MVNGKSGKSRRILLAVRIFVVLFGLTLAAIWLSDENTRASLKRAFARMDLWVFACVFSVFLVSQLVVVLRWWLLLRTQGVYIDFWAAVRLYFLGWFYNNVMPGSVGGDLVRIWFVTKHTEKKFEAGLSVFVDRAIGLFSTLVIAVFFYFVFLWPEKLPLVATVFKYWWLALGVFLAVLGSLSVFGRGRILLGKLWGGACKAWRKLVGAARFYGKSPLTLFLAFALTLVLQMATITGFWFLGTSIGIEVSIKYYYVFFTLVWVIGAVPVSVAGAFVVEGALAVLFIKMAHVPEADAGALALLQRFVWLLASLPGALIHLTGTHLPKDFSVDGEGLAE